MPILLGLNIMGMEDGPSSAAAGVVRELGPSWLGTGPDGVNMAGGAMEEDGGAPLGTMAGPLTGLDIPDWLKTST